jgi:uncharacterized alkaline shock family protein YloU
MTDDARHGAGQHIPTPAEVHHDHPTVLVPVPEDGEAVRRIETHDDTASVGAAPSSAPTDPFPTSSPSTDSPYVDLAFSGGDESTTDDLARFVADAAAAVPGVHGLSSAAARAVDSARTRLLGRTAVPGVDVLAEADALSVDVSLVAEYPANVSEVADAVRADVAAALATRHDGPLDIDVTVTDVHGPFDPEDPDPGQAIDDAQTAGAQAAADVRDDTADRMDDLADDIDAARADAEARDAVVETEATQPTEDMADAAEKLADAADSLAVAAEGVAQAGSTDDALVSDTGAVRTRDADTDTRQTTDRRPSDEL